MQHTGKRRLNRARCISSVECVKEYTLIRTEPLLLILLGSGSLPNYSSVKSENHSMVPVSQIPYISKSFKTSFIQKSLFFSLKGWFALWIAEVLLFVVITGELMRCISFKTWFCQVMSLHNSHGSYWKQIKVNRILENLVFCRTLMMNILESDPNSVKIWDLLNCINHLY